MAMNKLYPLTLLALAALAGCAPGSVRTEGPGPATAATGLNPQPARITDSRIAADRETLDQIQLRLRRLNEAGIPQNNYPLAKAQCWLDTARTQYNENDRTGYIEESLSESVKIIQALEADKNAKVGYATPLVARSSRLRDDLWARLDGFKANDATLVCTARTVACGEVRLVRAGHAEQQTGWRQATTHVQMVEDAVRRAEIEAASCPQPVAPVAAKSVAAAAPAAAPAAVAAAVPAATQESFILLTDALFRFDRSGRDEMLPGGLQRLATIADRLKSYKSIASITIVGHSDRLGSDEYNDKLSQARAETVKAQLEALGIKAASVSAKGAGKREPLTKDCSDKLPRAELTQCLQPDRRVTIEVSGVVR